MIKKPMLSMSVAMTALAITLSSASAQPVFSKAKNTNLTSQDNLVLVKNTQNKTRSDAYSYSYSQKSYNDQEYYYGSPYDGYGPDSYYGYDEGDYVGISPTREFFQNQGQNGN